MNLRDLFFAMGLGNSGGAVSSEQIEEAVNNYLAENPAGVDLAMTGAAVGQIAKITAVDDSGVPTAWEPVDLPSGGGSEEWEHICDISVVEDTENPITTVEQKLGADYRKIMVLINNNKAGGIVNPGSDSFPLRIRANNNGNDTVGLVAMFGSWAATSGWNTLRAVIEFVSAGKFTMGVSYIYGSGAAVMEKVNFNVTVPIHTICLQANGGMLTFTANIYGVRA